MERDQKKRLESGGGLPGAGGAGGRNLAELLRFKAGRMKAELQQVCSVPCRVV